MNVICADVSEKMMHEGDEYECAEWQRRKEKKRRSDGRESLTSPNSKKRLKLLVAQGFREIDRRFITAPSLLTIWVLSISLMQLKPHLKNKHNMDLAMSSPSKHLGLYRYNFNIQRNKNSATLNLSSSTLQRVWKYWRHSVKRPARGLILGEVNNSPLELF